MNNQITIPKVDFKGPESKDTLSFRYYDADRVIMGKPMKDHLKFAMSWWHTLCAGGTDMFGRETFDKSFGPYQETM